MTTLRKALLALLLAGCAGTASAQFAPSQPQDVPMVSDLVVVPADGGPPWWKVSDADTTVYIFADPGPLPYGVTFDRTALNRRLKGANELILAPRFRDTIGQKFTLPFGSREIMRDMNGARDKVLEASLPPDIRARFVEARLKARQPEERYGSLPPGLAGMAVAGDYDAVRGADNAPRAGSQSVERIVEEAARAARIKRIQPARIYGRKEADGISKDLYKPGLPCLVSSLDTLDLLPPLQRDLAARDEAARAWAGGDVRPLLALTRRHGRTPWLTASSETLDGKTARVRFSTPECIRPMTTISAVSASYIGDQAEAVVRALRRPGKAVAVFDPTYMLIQDGILDRLRRRGFTVTSPDDLTD